MSSSTNATDLSGKVAVVTGAAAGLGRAEALGLARLGATVVVNDIAAAPGCLRRRRRDQRGAGRRRSPWPATSANAQTADELISTADGLGGLDIVVNNAGITRDRMLFNMTDEEWDLVIAVHLRGHFLLTRNAATYWRSQSQRSRGRLRLRPDHQHLVGGRAWSGPVGQANYGAAKAGITALTLSAARALGRYGVCANAICPRARTAMTADVFGAAPEERRDRPVVTRACGEPGAVPGVAGRRRGQRSGVHRVRSARDVGCGADRGAPVQRGWFGLGSRSAEHDACRTTLLAVIRTSIFPRPD